MIYKKVLVILFRLKIIMKPKLNKLNKKNLKKNNLNKKIKKVNKNV